MNIFCKKITQSDCDCPYCKAKSFIISSYGKAESCVINVYNLSKNCVIDCSHKLLVGANLMFDILDNFLECLRCFIVRCLHCFCCKREKGRVVLTYGQHEIQVETKCKPHRVYLSMDNCNHQVCGSDVSMSGAVINDNGFTIFADVKADVCVVNWLACHCCCN